MAKTTPKIFTPEIRKSAYLTLRNLADTLRRAIPAKNHEDFNPMRAACELIDVAAENISDSGEATGDVDLVCEKLKGARVKLRAVANKDDLAAQIAWPIKSIEKHIAELSQYCGPVQNS